MLKTGEINILKIAEISGKMCFLDGGEEGLVFFPVKELPPGSEEGDEIEVFVYCEKEGLAATRKKPLAYAGEFAFLEVKSVTDFGIFLDWGIDKDLYMPNRLYEKSYYRKKQLTRGDKIIVYITRDATSPGVIASPFIEKHLEKETGELEVNDEVDILVYRFSDIGANVIINNRFHGILYYNEIFSPLSAGDRRKGYIKKIRTDGLVDASLQKQGFTASNIDSEETILRELERNSGFLPIHDKSTPDEIKKHLKMSKKSFKKAAGTLYRKKIIIIEEEGIRLTDKQE